MALTADEVIERLALEPLPGEGGWYRETYRSQLRLPVEALPEGYDGARDATTAILFLLTPVTVSAMHRVAADEVFHFHAGDPVEMVIVSPDGDADRVVLGADLEAGHTPQVVVPANWWQGARLIPGGEWGLMATTVTPGFEFEDLELGDPDVIADDHPELADLIRDLRPESA